MFPAAASDPELRLRGLNAACLSQADSGRHGADVGLQLRGGQRAGEGAALLLRLHRVQRETPVTAPLDFYLVFSVTAFVAFILYDSPVLSHYPPFKINVS